VLAGSAYAIPNTFSEGDIVSAEKMNENFQALEQQFQGSRATTVNCEANEKIGDAISNGYTNITVSGTCTENLLFFEEWGDNTFALAPRYLKLTGADSTAKIVDATGGSEATIFVGAGTTLSMENMTISGGTYGVAAYRNSNLLLSGVTIEGFTQRGISIGDSSYLGVNDGGVTITGGTGSEFGIYFTNGSSGWVHTSNISNVERAINLYAQSFTYLYNFNFNASKRGINLGDHSTVVRYQDGAGVIEGTSEYAINASQGNFYSWSSGSLTIQKLNGGRGINVSRGNSHIANLKMPDYDNTGSDWNPAIGVYTNSSLSLENAEISGSTDGALVAISAGSVTEIQDSTLTVGNAGAGIEASGSSRLSFRNSTISGTVTDNLVSVSNGSSADVRDSTLTITSGERGLRVAGSSQLKFRDSTISGTVTDGSLVSVDAGSSAEVRDATLTLDSGNRAVGVSESSHLQIRNSKISGTATDELIRVTRGSNAIISNETTLSQTSSDTPDVSVSNLSMLSIWNEEASINKVDCYSKGYVSANEGIVTTLSESCTE